MSWNHCSASKYYHGQSSLKSGQNNLLMKTNHFRILPTCFSESYLHHLSYKIIILSYVHINHADKLILFYTCWIYSWTNRSQIDLGGLFYLIVLDSVINPDSDYNSDSDSVILCETFSLLFWLSRVCAVFEQPKLAGMTCDEL